MEAPDGAEMIETVIETGLEATIEQIIPIQAISVIAAGTRSGLCRPEVAPRP
jgi:hypothetical protein